MFRAKPTPSYTLKVLTLVGTFGYLSTREIALLGWASITPKAALKAAQLATTQLCKAGLLLARKVELHGVTHAYVLTKPGAAWLNNEHLEVSFTDGYSLATNQLLLRQPTIMLAHEFVKVHGYGVAGARGLAHDCLCMDGLQGLDAVLYEPTTYQPVFGILQVRHYDKATVARVSKHATLSVPVLLATGEAHDRKLPAFIKIRAQYSDAHEATIAAALPHPGMLC